MAADNASPKTEDSKFSVPIPLVAGGIIVVLGLSAISNWFDKYIIDGIVNTVGRAVKQLSFLAGLHDRLGRAAALVDVEQPTK